MDLISDSISRVLVLGAEPQARANVVDKLFKLCDQKLGPNASQGTHKLALQTKYYTAELELHVHAVESNEILTPLEHDAESYEAMIWVVDASSDKSFLETHHFVDNSIDELEFDVSLLVGDHASAASNAQLRRLEQWAQENGFEFIALDQRSSDATTGNQEEPRETRGMDRVVEALQCNMWTSLTMIESTGGDAHPAASTNPSQDEPVAAEHVEEEKQEEETPPSKVLVLGSDVDHQRQVVHALAALNDKESNLSASKDPTHGMEVIELKTKFYTAALEVHLHRIEQNELVAPLVHDVDKYEAIVWVVDAASDKSFVEVKQFVEKSLEELDFRVSLLVGRAVTDASGVQLAALEKWGQDNAFEFVPLRLDTANNQTEHSSMEEKQGLDRVLEALQCNIWSSMKTVDARPAQAADALATPAEKKVKVTPQPQVPTVEELPKATVPTLPASVAEPSLDDRFQSSLSASGLDEDDPEMAAFAGLLSQVRWVRDTGSSLSDLERRRQAEQMAMQLWNMLGEYTTEQVVKHNTDADCWLIIGADGAKKVYDVTAFLEDHPGGPEVLLDLAGQDVQDEFEDIGHTNDARAMLHELCIGVLKEDDQDRLIHEACKLERLSMLKHPEMLRTGSDNARYSKASIITAIIVVMIGVAATVLGLGRR